ncbi:MAG: response regulator transcription factor [Pontixanthobacter sp.]
MRSCLICDDHAMMREALIGTVELGWPDATITHAADYPAAIALIAAQPDLCITDLSMPGAAIIDGISALLSASPDTPVLVVTGNEDDAILVALFQMGISGFITKSSKSSVLLAAIQIVLAGEAYIPSRLLELVGKDAATPPTPANPPAGQLRLTDRQGAVLRLIADGKSNKEIARDLDISPATAKAHVAAVVGILGAKNRTDAAMKAKAAGFF